MLAAGTTNHALARELFISIDTVKKHVSTCSSRPVSGSIRPGTAGQHFARNPAR